MIETTVWVITSEYNAYDQYGEYLEKIYAHKPTEKQILKFLEDRKEIDKWHGEEYKNKRIQHLLDGGGRMDIEDLWFNLREERLG